MITKDEILPLLASSCPSFSDEYKKNIENKSESYWFDGDKFLAYIALADFSHHIVDLYKANQTTEFKNIFSAIERLHIEGDDFVREAVTIGLLEGIQNIAGNSEIDPEVFTPHLLPESLKWWQKLNDFWSGKKPTVS